MTFSAIFDRANASPKVTLAVTAGAMFVLVLASWFVLVSPKNSRTSELDGKIQEVQAQLGTQLSQRGGRPTGMDHRTLRGLERAIPDQPQVSRLVRELNTLAHGANLTLDTVTPQTPTASGGGYEAIPLTVVVDGDFLAVRSFMRALRNQVSVQGRSVRASGRLYDVQSLDFEQSNDPRPNVRATLTMQAFVFAPAPAGSASSATRTTTTTTANTGK